jgi:hypothetical protein
MIRTTLRGLLATLGATAVAIALSIDLLGAAATAGAGQRLFDLVAGQPAAPPTPWPADMDNELRFYAAMWGAYGLLLLATARDLTARLAWVPWLAGVFFAGGVGRAISWISVGAPHPFFLALMAAELALPPAFVALWLMERRTLP